MGKGWGSNEWGSNPWGDISKALEIGSPPTPSTMWAEDYRPSFHPQDVVHDRIWAGGDSHPYTPQKDKMWGEK